MCLKSLCSQIFMNNHDNPYQIIQQTLSAPSRDTCRYEPRFYSSFVVIPFQMPKLDGMTYQKTDLCTELQIKIVKIQVKDTVFRTKISVISFIRSYPSISILVNL